jgi:proteasome lid subunit RPN8/RPN11
MGVTISSTAQRAVRAAAAASPGVEACGLLLGQGDHVVEAVACRNVAGDPAVRFEIDPRALLAAHRAARAGGNAVLGHFHSHPKGSPMPSPRDAADAAADEGRFEPVACALDALASEGRV